MFCHEIITEGASNIGDTGVKSLSEAELHKQRRTLKEKQVAAKKKQKEDKEKKEKEEAEKKRQQALSKTKTQTQKTFNRCSIQ